MGGMSSTVRENAADSAYQTRQSGRRRSSGLALSRTTRSRRARRSPGGGTIARTRWWSRSTASTCIHASMPQPWAVWASWRRSSGVVATRWAMAAWIVSNGTGPSAVGSRMCIPIVSIG